MERRELDRDQQASARQVGLVLFLFLVHLALGIAFTLVVVAKAAGVKFFRFNAGLAGVLIAIAFALRPAGIAEGAMARVALGALVIAEAALVVYWATVGRMLASIRPALVWTWTGAGAAAIVAEALAIAAGRSVPVQALTIASFLSSAALLGGACTAMVLGHWYLVIPSMQTDYLQSLVKVHIVSTLIRVAVVVAIVFFAIVSWQPGAGINFARYITSIDGVFFWQRVLFGLGGPAVLSFLTWETAKIRSTQSATGILYVDFFTVVVGEVLAKYILLATRVPV